MTDILQAIGAILAAFAGVWLWGQHKVRQARKQRDDEAARKTLEDVRDAYDAADSVRDDPDPAGSLRDRTKRWRGN